MRLLIIQFLQRLLPHFQFLINKTFLVVSQKNFFNKNSSSILIKMIYCRLIRRIMNNPNVVCLTKPSPEQLHNLFIEFVIIKKFVSYRAAVGSIGMGRRSERKQIRCNITTYQQLTGLLREISLTLCRFGCISRVRDAG